MKTKTKKDIGAQEASRLESEFAKAMPGKRLLALQLDGFSHRVIFDDVPKTPKAHGVSVSFCMGEAEELSHCENEEEKATHLAIRGFLAACGYNSHFSYQNNPVEIILVQPEER